MKKDRTTLWTAISGVALLVVPLATRELTGRGLMTEGLLWGAALLLLAIAGLCVALLVEAAPKLRTLWGTLGVAAVVILALVVSGLPRLAPFIGPLWDRPDASRALVVLILLVQAWCFVALYSRFRFTRAELAGLRALSRRLPQSGEVDLDGLQSSLAGKGLWDESVVGRRLRLMVDNAALPDRAVRLLSEEAVQDATRLQIDYGPLRALVWALPALGFIGTAAAMAGSIAGVGSALDGAAGPSRSGLPQAQYDLLARVIPNLADAFSITLLALGGTVLCFFLLSVTYAREEKVLNETNALATQWLERIWAPRHLGPASVSDQLIAELWSLEREVAKLSGQLERVLEGRGYSETLSGFLTAIVAQLSLLNQGKFPEALETSADGSRESQIGASLREISGHLKELNQHLAMRRAAGPAAGLEERIIVD